MSKLNLGVDIHTFENEWPMVVAKQTAKYSKKYELECWQPESTFKETYSREKDGITYKIYPSCYVPVNGFKDIEISIPLLKEIQKQKSDEILIHLFNPFHVFHSVIPIVFNDLPIVASILGGSYNPRNRLIRKINFVEKIAFKNTDRFFCSMTANRNAYDKTFGKKRVVIRDAGAASVDFEAFKPIDKYAARIILGLSPSKKIILYVGRLYKLKGADLILKTFDELKNKYDLECICIGNHPSDPLYSAAKSVGAKVFGVLPQSELIPYYSTSDVFVSAPFDQNLLDWGGIGAAMVEALACNTPVVSPTLRHFPQQDVEKIGKIPRAPEDLKGDICDVLDNPTRYNKCRETARKYYDWSITINNLIETYDELYDIYYSSGFKRSHK